MKTHRKDRNILRNKEQGQEDEEDNIMEEEDANEEKQAEEESGEEVNIDAELYEPIVNFIIYFKAKIKTKSCLTKFEKVVDYKHAAGQTCIFIKQKRYGYK